MDYSSLYRTMIVKSFDEDLADILEKFKVLANQGASCKLVNYYRGLPITYKADIIALDKGVLDLDVHQQQAVVLNSDRKAFIKCSAFPYDIFATVQYINVRRMAVSLTKFTYVQIMAEQRNALRLELDPATDASFSVDAATLEGKLFDISLSGASVRLDKSFSVEKGVTTQLQLMLPNLVQETQTMLKCQAKLMAVRDYGDSNMCQFAIYPEKQQEPLISQYIFQRQVEIIRELKDVA